MRVSLLVYRSTNTFSSLSLTLSLTLALPLSHPLPPSLSLRVSVIDGVLGLRISRLLLAVSAWLPTRWSAIKVKSQGVRRREKGQLLH